MNIIQKIRSWFFGKEEVVETPVVETPVVEAPAPVVTKEEVAEMVKHQEQKPKPKRKYNKKKKSTGEAK